MRLSFHLFRVFGVDIRVHVTFVFIVAYFAYLWGVVEPPGGGWGALYGVLTVVILSILVVIHGLSHSRVAQHYGNKVPSITLLPIGGVSAMERIPEEPRKQLAISVALLRRVQAAKPPGTSPGAAAADDFADGTPGGSGTSS
jgi:Zn-dependent protease